MPGGKYVNMPVTVIDDLWVLLWNLRPKPMARLTAVQIEAIYKQVGKLLKANKWHMPQPDAMAKARIKAAREARVEIKRGETAKAKTEAKEIREGKAAIAKLAKLEKAKKK